MSSHRPELLDDLTQLAQNDLSLLDFYSQLLPRLSSQLSAEGMAVWLCEGDQIKPFCRHGLSDSAANGQGGQLERHVTLLNRVRTAGQAAYVLPKSAESSSHWANPTEYLLGICPIKVDDSVVALLESYHGRDAQPQDREANLRSLRAAAGVAGRFHHNAELRQLRQRRAWWDQFETFSQAVHASLDPKQTAYTIANEGRLLLKCDRVSVLVRRGRGYHVAAVSGHDWMNRRANTVVLLEELVASTMVLGEAFRYPYESAEELPPQVELAVESYVENSQCRELVIHPLMVGTATGDATEGHSASTRVVGALVAEQFSAASIAGELIPHVGRQAENALGNALEHHEVFLLPLWKALGRFRWLMSTENLPRTAMVALTIVTVLAALVLIPADFELSAEGTLQPESRRHVFSQADGVVDELLARHGSRVRRGETLAKLRSSEIELKLLEVQGELEATAKKLAAAKAARVSMSANPAAERMRVNQLAAEEAELREWLTNLQQQQRLLLERQQRLVVQSPLDGEVITWDLENLLTARPVQRGAILMTVAQMDGPWVLELLLPDKRVGHLRTASQDSPLGLPVSFILATNPGERLNGSVKTVGRSMVTDEDLGLCLPVTVDLEESDIPRPRPGAKVIARIHCGRRPLGYVWFHQVLEFFQTHVVFRFS
jgi:hypothetical protein